MTKRDNKRGILLIDKGFQLRLIGLGLVYSLIVMGTFAMVMFGPLVMDLHDGDISDPKVQAAAQQFLTLHLRVWPPVFIVLALLIVHHVVVSHRVAGPLYRMRITMQAMARGDISAKIVVRGKDYLVKDVVALNELLVSLREKVNGLADDCQAADTALAELREANDHASSEVIHQKREEVQAYVNRIRDGLRWFKTGSPSTPVIRQARAENHTLEPEGVEL